MPDLMLWLANLLDINLFQAFVVLIKEALEI